MSAGVVAGLSAVKLALQARQRRAESIAALRADPVAIIGMACRMPGGADSPEALWSLLRAGRTTAGPVPQERWDAAAWYDPDESAPGKSITREGSFLQPADGHGIDAFDAAYFGIAGREADRMDPQQRLLLEVAYEAIDDAGIDQRALAGSRSGVFIGSYHDDYAQLQAADAQAIELRTLTGTLHSVLASRMSYLLDLRGPALAVDTACSASLVAIHLACQSLRWGESDLAITGGVSLMLTPALMVMMSKVGFMASDGRSKTFEASADGFGRGEGCGVLVLRRLADAVAAGDRIWAVIRGSAVNQDGRSTLLTAPNGPAQEAMIREALGAAQLTPSRIGYVETHGTGTSLGDPIEVEAVAAVLGRPDAEAGPCWLGGIKANLGHLEAAAGVAGVMKAALALHHRAIPPQPSFTTVNPHIRLDGTRLAIPTTLVPWDSAKDAPRCAAVSAFGVGGTNAHVILEEAPVVPLSAPKSRDGTHRAEGADGTEGGGAAAWLLPLSAKSPAALAARARDLVKFLGEDVASIADLCHSAARRTPFAHRAAVVGRTRPELAHALRRWLEEAPAATEAQVNSGYPARAGVPAGVGIPLSPGGHASGVVFVFSGQGPQWFAMGRELLQAEPVFRERLMAVEALLTPLAGWSLLDELARSESDSRLQQTAFAQPALFAVQVALAALWRAWGVEPSAVIGHSIGEIAALQVAGALDLEDAVRVVFHRGRIMQGAPDPGRMAALSLTESAAQVLIAPFGGRLAIAAVNAPRSVVLSGEPAALQTAAQADPAHSLLPVRLAFHSAQMDPCRDALVAVIGAGWQSRPAQIPVYSTVTGARAEGPFDAQYFGRNLRDTVRFADAVMALPPGMAFLEIGPHPVLVQPLAACLEARGVTAPVIAASLRRGRPERETLLHAAATLFTAGALELPVRVQPAPGRIVSLPAYPWQRQSHWLRPTSTPALHPAAASGQQPTAGSEHPLLGSLIRIAGSDIRVYRPSPGRARDWLDQHRVLGKLIVPGAAVMEAFLAAARTMFGEPASLLDFEMQRPLELRDSGSRWQIVVSATVGEAGQITLTWFDAVSNAEDDWQCVARASAQRAAPVVTPPQLRLTGRVATVDRNQLYARFAAMGVEFGADFRLLADIRHTPGGASAMVTPPARLDLAGFGLHPVLLDAAVQLCSVAAGPNTGGGVPRHLYLPVGADEITVRPPAAGAWQRHPLRVHAHLHTDVADALVADVAILTADGLCIAELKGLHLARASRFAFDDLPLYDLAWERLPSTEPMPEPVEGPYLLFAGDEVARTLEAELPGVQLRVVPGPGYARRAAHVWQIDPTDPEQLRRVLQEAGWQGGTIVHAWSLDVPAGDSTGVDAASLAGLLHLVQAAQAGRMFIVTRGAQAVGDQEALTGLCPAAAALWGLAAAIRTEEPALRLRAIDLDPADSGATGLMAEMLAGDAAPTVAVRGLLRWRPALHRQALRERSAVRGQRLVVRRPGTFEGLDWEAVADTAPAAGEVRLRVQAAGLNFRDALLTLGMYPGAAVPLGAECAGVVEAVGPGVALTAGQRVFGLATACLAGTVTVPAAFIAVMPERLGMVEAAALPVAFFTGMYGLHRLAGLRAGESVLIHAAAGGVGLAAVQLAQRAGAQVFATAGSPAKRALLRALGVHQVMDSRSVAFAGEVLAATGGRGVDIVLNSLAGEFIPAGLRALARGGRFLELGKRGVWSAEQVAALRPDVGYFLYDLNAAAAADHALLPPLFAELTDALADGSLRPLPIAEYPAAAAAQALRALAQARHVGKLVLRIADDPPRELPPLRQDATYWITGGLSGIGLETAFWLAARGARHLLLTGRSAPSPVAQARIAELESRGVRIVVGKADAADRTAMARVMQAVDVTHPLRGVVHAAGELQDGVLAGQVWSKAEAVLRGKLIGAWTLHRLTQPLNLDFFILYSAAGALLGPRGQGLYPAANVALDALAQYRRRRGLPALSVAWGRWADVGMAARASARDADAWSVRGLGPIDPLLGFSALERLMAQGARHGIVLPIDWQRFMATLPEGMDRGFFARVGRATTSSAASAATTGIAAPGAPGMTALRKLPVTERRAALSALIRDRTLVVIGLDPVSTVDPRQPLKDIGLDSLMAVELRNVLIHEGGRRLPATLLFDYPTLDALTGHLLKVWELVGHDVAPVPGASIPVDVSELSEAEAEAQLTAELNAGGHR